MKHERVPILFCPYSNHCHSTAPYTPSSQLKSKQAWHIGLKLSQLCSASKCSLGGTNPWALSHCIHAGCAIGMVQDLPLRFLLSWFSGNSNSCFHPDGRILLPWPEAVPKSLVLQTCLGVAKQVGVLGTERTTIHQLLQRRHSRQAAFEFTPTRSGLRVALIPGRYTARPLFPNCRV